MLATISDILKSKGMAVRTTCSTDTLTMAVNQMTKLNIGALPVVDDDRLVGILSERDILTKVVNHRLNLDTTKVAEVMSPNPISVQPGARVIETMQLMSKKRFRHLPIVENGQLIGMVSMGDITARIIADQDDSLNRMIGAVKAMRIAG